MKEKKRKVGRPKLPKREIRNVIAIRMTDMEKRSYEREASDAGIGLSEWIRNTMTKEHLANLSRKGAALSRSKPTYFDAFEVQPRDHEWCIKFLPDMTEVLIRPADFRDDEQIVQELKRQLNLLTS
jgi:hypothetical protein